MKKTIKIVALFVALAFSANSNAQESNDQCLIARAIAASHQCLGQDPGGLDINGFVETTGICYVSGETKKVTVFAAPKCHHHPCPMYASRLVATVEFDCEGNIASVTCL